MKKITRIVIKSSSGYGAFSDAYDDRITITEKGIQYVYKPLDLVTNQPVKWSYRTDRQEFREAWAELCKVIPGALAVEPDLVLDAGEMSFFVTYEDKSKAAQTFWGVNSELVYTCFRIIRRMLPGSEMIPKALWLPEDEEEDE